MRKRPNKALPPVDYLKECFSYDEHSGAMLWRERPHKHFTPGRTRTAEHKCNNWNALYASKPVSNVSRYGRVRIDGNGFLVHRIIWKLQTGQDPTGEVDHRDLGKINNRWNNLRDATHADNMRNRHAYTNNPSGGLKGAYPLQKKWQAKITYRGKSHYLGVFETAAAAHAAYVAAAIELFGEFANTGER